MSSSDPYGPEYQPPQQPPPQPYQPYQQPPQYGPPRATNGMAIASLVLGILWIYGIGAILALVFGYTAKKQIRERGEGGSGLATAGIVLGWIGVAGLVVIILALVVLAAGSSTSARGY